MSKAIQIAFFGMRERLLALHQWLLRRAKFPLYFHFVPDFYSHAKRSFLGSLYPSEWIKLQASFRYASCIGTARTLKHGNLCLKAVGENRTL